MAALPVGAGICERSFPLSNVTFGICRSRVPDATCKGCGGESGGNCALYVAARHLLALFAERDCKGTTNILDHFRFIPFCSQTSVYFRF